MKLPLPIVMGAACDAAHIVPSTSTNADTGDLIPFIIFGSPGQRTVGKLYKQPDKTLSQAPSSTICACDVQPEEYKRPALRGLLLLSLSAVYGPETERPYRTFGRIYTKLGVIRMDRITEDVRPRGGSH
jgi:hypothetical protein